MNFMQDCKIHDFLQIFHYHEVSNFESFYPINLHFQTFRFPFHVCDLFAKIVTTFEENLQNHCIDSIRHESIIRKIIWPWPISSSFVCSPKNELWIFESSRKIFILKIGLIQWHAQNELSIIIHFYNCFQEHLCWEYSL